MTSGWSNRENRVASPQKRRPRPARRAEAQSAEASRRCKAAQPPRSRSVPKPPALLGVIQSSPAAFVSVVIEDANRRQRHRKKC